MHNSAKRKRHREWIERERKHGRSMVYDSYTPNYSLCLDLEPTHHSPQMTQPSIPRTPRPSDSGPSEFERMPPQGPAVFRPERNFEDHTVRRDSFSGYEIESSTVFHKTKEPLSGPGSHSQSFPPRCGTMVAVLPNQPYRDASTDVKMQNASLEGPISALRRLDGSSTNPDQDGAKHGLSSAGLLHDQSGERVIKMTKHDDARDTSQRMNDASSISQDMAQGDDGYSLPSGPRLCRTAPTTTPIDLTSHSLSTTHSEPVELHQLENVNCSQNTHKVSRRVPAAATCVTMQIPNRNITPHNWTRKHQPLNQELNSPMSRDADILREDLKTAKLRIVDLELENGRLQREFTNLSLQSEHKERLIASFELAKELQDRMVGLIRAGHVMNLEAMERFLDKANLLQVFFASSG